MGKPLLSVNDLAVSFRRTENKQTIVTDVVKNVSFDIHSVETVALVGESGSGKSLSALSILQLLPYPQAFHPSGSIQYGGTELIGADSQTLQRVRGNDISMIFQEPMTALNPLHTIEKQIGESLSLHQGLSGSGATQSIIELMDRVGIRNPKSRLGAYPHQLSGGQRQRIMIAMALANKPEILLADEPTTALDVTVQARILKLLMSIQRQEGLGILLISHDLNMVRKVADRVLVLQNGSMVEKGITKQLFMSPQHSYTKTLISAEPPDRDPPTKKGDIIFQARNLQVWFPVKKGLLRKTVDHIKAVNDASVTLYPGHTLGVVGESGSGKTTLALALLRLVHSQGKISLKGQSIDRPDKASMKMIRRQLQIVFQDPFGSLSPRMSISDIISEGLDAHGLVTNAAKRDTRVIDILEQVEIDPDVRFRYPHELSGGQRQRIAIARALILEPAILVLDEPTSALDRTVQVQILDLLNRIQRQQDLAYVFISHDLSVVKFIADHLMVMQNGDVVEAGDASEIFHRPQHSYTQELLAAALS
ncbi:MAG: dipeptide ABC transporter ATP-binding protein [Gammaproteobacteria bacterium]|nr:dipeptide ABC transporter ATP-binding protein [Gammaproteobacteria bacterium]